MGQGDTILNAVIGAVVTIVASFIPFSPVLGGAVAAYLQQEDSSSALKVGAISGAISLIPFALLLFGLGSVFSLSFLPMVGSGGGTAVGLVGGFFVIVLLIGAVYTILFSALGGYLGWYVRKENVGGGSTEGISGER